MKKLKFLLLTTCIGVMAFTAPGCKSKTDAADSTKVDNTTTNTTTTAPAVSADDELQKSVTDATKDYPTVKAQVSNGEVILTGQINRADWQKLNPTLNSLHPKKVTSTNLTIK